MDHHGDESHVAWTSPMNQLIIDHTPHDSAKVGRMTSYQFPITLINPHDYAFNPRSYAFSRTHEKLVMGQILLFMHVYRNKHTVNQVAVFTIYFCLLLQLTYNNLLDFTLLCTG